MPNGDWGPGARLVQLHVEMDVDPDDLHVTHAGIGYHVRVPSGKQHPGGLTVHSPDGNYAIAPRSLAARLEEIAREMAQMAAAHEGLQAYRPIGTSIHDSGLKFRPTRIAITSSH